MDAPFRSGIMEIKPDWIDYNGHLNMAYYSVLFDWAVDEVQEALGLGPGYREATGCTTYSAEFRIRYLRELHLGDRVFSTVYIVDTGPKSYHFAQELWHVDGWCAATGEGISLHVDQSGGRPRVAAYPDQIRQKLDQMRAAHAQCAVPDFVGLPMALRK